jgi:hypothetical protein
LWSAEEIVELNRAYEVEDSVPGFFGFGTDGGGELFAFRLKASQPWQVYMIPFIPMEETAAVLVAEDFTQLTKAFGQDLGDFG